MKWLILLFFLLLIPLSSAYVVNQSITVQVTVQHDNGVTLTPVIVQACIGSVYSYGNYQLIVRDQNLTAGNPYHSFSFVPNYVGDYSISVKCDYLNESATYFERILVSPPTQNIPMAGGQTLVLNAVISTPQDAFTVNIRDQPVLTFQVNYLIDNKLSSAQESYWRIMKDDKVLKQGNFGVLSTGVYEFDANFSDFLPDSYKLYLIFNGKTKVVDLNVVSVEPDLSFITGSFVSPVTGQLDKVKTVIGIVWFLVFIFFTYVLVARLFGKNEHRRSVVLAGLLWLIWIGVGILFVFRSNADFSSMFFDASGQLIKVKAVLAIVEFLAFIVVAYFTFRSSSKKKK